VKRSIAFCALVLAAIPVAARALEGHYALYADERRSSCALEDRTAGTVYVHMFAEGIRGLLVVELVAPVPDCWEGATWLADVIPHELVIGDTQKGGLAVFVGTPGTGVCETAIAPDPAYIGSISIQTQGRARSCCAYPILPGGSADGPDPVAAVCGGRDGVQKVPVGKQGAVINADVSCPCKALQPLPVEETSWGRVKALYK
jgi:hypothetical protein